MKRLATTRVLLWVASLLALVVAYTLVASRVNRPDVIPGSQDIAEAFTTLVSHPALPQPSPPAGDAPMAGMEGMEGHQGHAGHHHQHMRSSDQVDALLQEGVTLQESLLISSARVLFGLAVGLPLGILLGLWMGWSRRADEYLHPVYVLARSVPPLAFITYIMLWLGHSEAHRLIPIVYAVAVTAVIPTYHGVRDVAAKYLVAARSLGARPALLFNKVLLPAAAPAVLGGLRYSIAIAWMTAVGAEMLMAENGMGNLLVGGGMWAARNQTRSDPAVIMVGVMALAVGGWAMDAAARAATARLTRWVR